MCHRIFLVLVLLSLGLTGSASVSAQEIQISDQVNRRVIDQAPYKIDTIQSIEEIEVDLGEPGFSLRYVQTFGISEEPYVVDTDHLYMPNGLFIDDSNNIYVVEENGFRALGYSESGSDIFSVGKAGQPWHHDTYLSRPKDIVKDQPGNIWVVIDPALKQFDNSGNLLQIFPKENPWEGGSTNDRFSSPRGIAFDSGGRMYVSDEGNHRVQVYDFDIEGTPVYSTTIGITGEEGDDNEHFRYPAQIAFDSSDRLYVSDRENFRIQRCEYGTAWSCSTFHGIGIAGSGIDELDLAFGISVDASDSIWIADGYNKRIKKCSLEGICSLFASNISWPADVDTDTNGNVFVSDYGGYTIRKYNSTGGFIGIFKGISSIPYAIDNFHLNQPWGIEVAHDGSLFVTESYGYRLVKMNPSGEQVWFIGEAGVSGNDNSHFGSYEDGVRGNPASDSMGRIYVTDTGNHRVQIFNPDGSYYATIGVTSESGSDNYHFRNPVGVTIGPATDEIFVVDHYNQRIQVFNPDLTYKTTIGITEETGIDNDHFNGPIGAAVDRDGNVFVADATNERIQKCIPALNTYNCSTFVGETGVFSDDFGHFHPLSVDVDNYGRVFVADEWNNRLLVFDSSGAFLTIVGQRWGGLQASAFYNPAGVAIDPDGNVYVADFWAHRVQKYAPYVPGWMQVNINGFGLNYRNVINSLTVYNGSLYAGTWSNPDVAQIWRMDNLGIWSENSPPWSAANDLVWDMLVFGGDLYASTANSDTGGEIWRLTGENWEQVVMGGFGDPENYSVRAMAVFSDYLYAVTRTDSGVMNIFRSSSGNLGAWDLVVGNGFGSAGVGQDLVMEGYGQALFLGLGRNGVAELWRTTDGTSWAPIFTDGLGENNTNVSAMAEFDGDFYIGLRNIVTGGEVWRSEDGLIFSKVLNAGLGNPENGRPYGLFVFDDFMYLAFANTRTGGEVWRTYEGENWERVVEAGFGDSNNDYLSYFDNGMAIYNDHLVVGTMNGYNGGEVWMMLDKLFLPVVVR